MPRHRRRLCNIGAGFTLDLDLRPIENLFKFLIFFHLIFRVFLANAKCDGITAEKSLE